MLNDILGQSMVNIKELLLAGLSEESVDSLLTPLHQMVTYSPVYQEPLTHTGKPDNTFLEVGDHQVAHCCTLSSQLLSPPTHYTYRVHAPRQFCVTHSVVRYQDHCEVSQLL